LTNEANSTPSAARQNKNARKRVNVMSLADRRKRMHEAVRDLPEDKPSKLTSEDVETLREAGLDEVAEVAALYVSVKEIA
jgi:alkylhydroperoxidase family enzyme